MSRASASDDCTNLLFIGSFITHLDGIVLNFLHGRVNVFYLLNLRLISTTSCRCLFFFFAFGFGAEFSELSEPALTLFRLLDLGPWSLGGTPFAIFRVVIGMVTIRGEVDVWFKLVPIGFFKRLGKHTMIFYFS